MPGKKRPKRPKRPVQRFARWKRPGKRPGKRPRPGFRVQGSLRLRSGSETGLAQIERQGNGVTA